MQAGRAGVGQVGSKKLGCPNAGNRKNRAVVVNLKTAATIIEIAVAAFVVFAFVTE